MATNLNQILCNQFDGTNLLPHDFEPQSFLFCSICSKHFMMCGCTDLGHGQSMIYVMPPIPNHFTVMQRIQRWALLISVHPLLKSFSAIEFVKDLPKSFPEDLEIIKPIIQELMEKYKNDKTTTGLLDTCRKLKFENLQKGYELAVKDCDYIMDHFFSGNWGYPTMMEYTLLNNAIQQSAPEDFEPDTRQRFRSVFTAMGIILHTMETLLDKNRVLNYRLEDLNN
jgi:hypothetical protein